MRYENEIDRIRLDPGIGTWGSGDCLFGLVVPMLKAMTGIDHFETYRGRYKTARGALGVMHRAGFDNLADVVATEIAEVHPSLCRVGDIGAIPTDDDFGYSLGVINGDRIFVLHKDGLGHRPMSEVTRAFKVN